MSRAARLCPGRELWPPFGEPLAGALQIVVTTGGGSRVWSPVKLGLTFPTEAIIASGQGVT